MPVGAVFLAAIGFLCVQPCASDAVTNDGLDAVAPARSLAQVTGPVIETTIAGLTIRGRHRIEKLVVPDLDIVQEGDLRFLPLLRILGLLRCDTKEVGASVRFAADGGPAVSVDYAARTVTVDTLIWTGPMRLGVSDLTRLPEIYIPEETVAGALAMEITWDPAMFEYFIRAERPLSIFVSSRRSLLAFAGRRQETGFDLPGILPEAKAGRSILPVIEFAQLQAQASIARESQGQGVDGTFSPPRAGLWGQMAGGNMAVAISQKGSSPRDGYKLDRLTWRSGFEWGLLSAGSASLGLSDLVFPSVSLVGGTINGKVGPSANRELRDPSQMGRRQVFFPAQVFEGFAPLGSEVSLEVNGQFIETRKVEQVADAPPGEGWYRFEALNLTTNRLNDVRIVTTSPNGVVEETHRRVLGSDLLIGHRSLAFVGGVGGRRKISADDLSSEGLFAGGRMNYGLSQRLSVAASAAYQDGLFARDEPRYLEGETIEAPSLRTLHVGSSAAWQALDPLLLAMEVGRSHSLSDSAGGWAVRAEADYQVGRVRLHTATADYGSSFFDGQNPETKNVQGQGLSVGYQFRNGDQIGLRASRVVGGAQMKEIGAGWSLRGGLHGSALTLGAGRVWVDGAPEMSLYGLGFESRLPWSVSLRSRQEFGDDIRRRVRQGGFPPRTSSKLDLGRRLASGADGTTLFGGSSVRSLVELSRRMGTVWQISLRHGAASGFRRSLIDALWNGYQGGLWQGRLSLGHDWNTSSLFSNVRIERFLDRSRRSRMLLEHETVDRQWHVRLALQMQLDIGFSELRPVPLSTARIDPEAGGVKGRVFLDKNGNGLADHGEPGIENIEVGTDSGQRATTAKQGLFVFPNVSAQKRARISLRAESLPATYTPTQGTQDASIRPAAFTEVNLGLAPLCAISGRVLAVTQHADSASSEGVSGVRVLLLDPKGALAKDSVTGSDGAYYLGEIRPGTYTIRLDESSIPLNLRIDTEARTVRVASGVEPSETDGVDFRGEATPLPEGPKDDKPKIDYQVFD